MPWMDREEKTSLDPAHDEGNGHGIPHLWDCSSGVGVYKIPRVHQDALVEGSTCIIFKRAYLADALKPNGAVPWQWQKRE